MSLRGCGLATVDLRLNWNICPEGQYVGVTSKAIELCSHVPLRAV